MSEVSFPGPGPDGEQPPPGIPARDETGAANAQPDGQTAVPETRTRDEAAALPMGMPEDDWDGDAEMAAYIADLDGGRARIPEEWETSDAV